MLVEHDGRRPLVATTAYVAPTAVLCGDVTIGENARILFGAVVTAETGPVAIGESAIVMENALIRGRDGQHTAIRDHCLIGPHAHVNGAVIEDASFLATGTSVFPGARIGEGSEVRINGVVHVNTVLPPGSVVPIGWIAVGDPVQMFAPGQHEELWAVQRDLDFPGTVFGLSREQATMRRVTARYADLFGRHADDRVIDED
ncbi:MAG: gamma carbonic anhydrase family protein [Nocardioides sp.]